MVSTVAIEARQAALRGSSRRAESVSLNWWERRTRITAESRSCFSLHLVVACFAVLLNLLAFSRTSMSAPKVHYVTVRTGPNIAVVKYWGKRDAGPLNLACNASISLTMDNTDICAQTTVATSASFQEDRLWLNGKEEKVADSKRISGVLAQVRQRCKDPAVAAQHIHIVSRNSFPTAAGLASSAAGFAALTVAVAKLLGVQDSYPGELTTIARMGSGSACRSLSGGLVKWHLGEKDDGTDSIATQEAPESHWPIDMTILVANAAKKHTSSTSGMQNSIKTSALMAHRVKFCVDDRIERLTKVQFVLALSCRVPARRYFTVACPFAIGLFGT